MPLDDRLLVAALGGLLSLTGCKQNPSQPAPVRDAACDVLPGRSVTSMHDMPGLTLDQFRAMCEAMGGGIIEIHPHCGGMNSCQGISYDSNTGVLIEHTCAGLNTCTGFSCVQR